MPTTYLLDDITKWKSAPMHRLVLTNSAGNKWELYHPTSDSSWGIEPVTRRGMHGGERLCGWLLTITFRMLANELQSILATLDVSVGLDFSVVLILEPDDTELHGRRVGILLPSPCGVTYRVTKDVSGPVFEVVVTKALTSLYVESTTTIWNDDYTGTPDP
jgi:hypothetical protein